ncbi:hypothetical protein ACAG25_23300 [Mycobacterium sp. pV006]|uniref:hypothetical protein n=1 Tax=Mycobacterium sp. pV006 TaxID=3238983 RepID=UPI00351B69E8
MSRFRALAGGLDQVFSSASNGLIVFAVAVVSTPQLFGQISILMTALVAALGCTRGALGTPLLLKSNQTVEQIRREGSFALTSTLIVGPLLAAILLGVGLPLVGPGAVCLALAVPFVLAQDVLRYVVIAEGRPHIAAVWDGLWCVGTILLLVLSWIGSQFATVTLLLGGWAALAGVAMVGLLAAVRVHPRLSGWVSWIQAGWQHRLRYGVDAGLEQVSVFVVLAAVGLLTSPAVAAALRGATAIMAPIGMFGNAIQVVVISESTRLSSQPRQVWNSLFRLAVVTGFVTATGGFVVQLLPDAIGFYLLGDSWVLATQVLPFIVLEYVAAGFAVSLAIFLRTFNRSSETLALKAALSGALIIGSTSAAVLFGNAVGVAIGLAVSSILVTAVAFAWFMPWQPRPRAESVDIAAGSTINEPDDAKVFAEGVEPALLAEVDGALGNLEPQRAIAAHSLQPSSAPQPATGAGLLSQVRMTLPGQKPHLASVAKLRRAVVRSATPGVIAAWTFVVMAILVPVYIFQVTALPTDNLWVGPVLIIVVSVARFSWIMGTGERRLFEMIFWSFTYAFLGLAPLAQLLRGPWPVTVPRTDTTITAWASAIVLVGILAFLCGVGVDHILNNRRARSTRKDFDGFKQTVHYSRLMMLTIGTVVLNIYYLSLVGPFQFVKSRDESFQLLAANFPTPNIGVVFRSAVFMSLIVAWVGLIRYRREARIAADRGRPESRARLNLNLILVVVVGVLLANSLNPVSNARYLSGTAVLAVAAALGMFATRNRFRFSAYGFLLALLVIFPQADAFRYSSQANVDLSDPIESLQTPDYDSFAQIINGYLVAMRDGIDFGNQALGVVLFWIPRAIWPGKAYDTGIVIANSRGYGFTNLSAPLWIEFFMNGGWLVLVLGMFTLGVALHRWDTNLDRELALYSMPTILGCILPFYMLILLRGSLLQAAPYLFFTILCTLFVTRRTNSKTTVPKPFPLQPGRRPASRAAAEEVVSHV